MSNQLTEVERETFTLGDRVMTKVKELGRGSFETVYLVQDQHQKKLVMKVIQCKTSGTANLEAFSRMIGREVKSLQRLDHPHIVKYEGYYVEPYESPKKPIGRIFMEYCGQGDLENYFHKGNPPTLRIIRRIFFQIVSALAYCHHGLKIESVNGVGKFVPEEEWTAIFHRDIKLGNVLVVDADCTRFKVCDWGVSKEIDREMTGTVNAGTGSYRAPEIGNGLDWTTKADIYALGVMISSLVQLCNPSELGLRRFTELITQCTSEDPNNRPSSLRLLQFWNAVRDKDDSPIENLSTDLFFKVVVDVGRIESFPDNNRDRLCLLIEDGGGKVQSQAKETALQFAVKASETKLVERLKKAISDMEQGSDINRIMRRTRSLEVGIRNKDMSEETATTLKHELAKLDWEHWEAARDSPLHKASRKGESEVVGILLGAGAGVDTRNESGETALLQAALLGHVKVVAKLLGGGADANAQGRDGATALHIAAGKGHVKVVDRLLESGADLRTKDNNGWTAIDSAMRIQCAAVLNTLLSRKIKAAPILDSMDPPSRMKLRDLCPTAFGKEEEEEKEALPAKKATKKSTGSYKTSGQRYCRVKVEANISFRLRREFRLGLRKGGPGAGTELFLGRTKITITDEVDYMYPECRYSVGVDYMHSESRHSTGVDYMHSESRHSTGLPFKRVERDDRGYTVVRGGLEGERAGVRSATEGGLESERVEGRLESGRVGVNLVTKGERRNGPLSGAALRGELGDGTFRVEQLLTLAAAEGWRWVAVVQHMLELGVDVDSTDEGKPGKTALHLAAEKGHTEVVKVLLDAYAVIDRPDYEGLTALHLAARRGNNKVLELLLEAKAYSNGRESNGRTPLHLAVQCEKAQTVETLLRRATGLDVDAQDQLGGTPLHYAADQGYEAIAQMLLDADAKIALEDGSRKTALDIAVEKGHEGVAEVIRSHELMSMSF